MPPKRDASGRSKRAAEGSPHLLHETAGHLNDNYATVGVIGRGNFAEINLLRHKSTKEYAVLKTCCKLDAPSLAHLRNEAKVAADIVHSLVLKPLAIADSPGRAGSFSVLLPLCPGGDFLQLLKAQENGRFSEDDAKAYTCMVILAIQAVHKAGYAYRDLKPENLLIRENGYLMLADFGLAARFSQCGRARVGTQMYQAPEIVRKSGHGAAVDWWALGCLVCEILNGSHPFHMEDEDAIDKSILAFQIGSQVDQLVKPHWSSTVASLVSGLLEPDPGERLQGDAVLSNAWFASVDWEGVATMRIPAPRVPITLDSNEDSLLVELTQRCQSGFD